MDHETRDDFNTWWLARTVAHWLPLPTSILWNFCVTSWVGAYLLLERVFHRIEFPTGKTMNRFAEEY